MRNSPQCGKVSKRPGEGTALGQGSRPTYVQRTITAPLYFVQNECHINQSEKIYLETTLELTIFGQKQRLEGRRMDFNEFMKFSSEIAKYAVDWYQKTQPQSKPKLRHPDNRPRSPTW